MKQQCYINGIGMVNVQGTWRPGIFDEAKEIEDSLVYAQQPSYKELIPPAMIRRMSKGIKMGIFAAQQALDESRTETLDAVITGTGLGCLEDSEKFLRNVLDNDEEFLTPTSFIQSTHNTVGAQIALRLGCKAYNFTYVNGAVSFESALLDALLQVTAKEASNVLIGGVDEIHGYTFELKQLIGEVKAPDVHERVRESRTQGVNFGEGATFLTLGAEKSASTYAEVIDVHFQNKLSKDEIPAFITGFLQKNGLQAEEISLVMCGINGDMLFDDFYACFLNTFEEIPQTYYKHVIGQNDVASAFGLAAAAYILHAKTIPSILQWNSIKQSDFRYVLLYNQYLGKDHSLTLIRHVEK